jgi:hypothetical protein
MEGWFYVRYSPSALGKIVCEISDAFILALSLQKSTLQTDAVLVSIVVAVVLA